MFRMLWNTLKDRLHYLCNESVFMKVFLLNMHKATDFTAFYIFNPKVTGAS